MKPVTFLDYHYVSTDLSFPGGSVVKNPPVMQEMQVRTLGQEDPLEEGTATHSIPLSGESHGQRAWLATVPMIAKSRPRL